MMIRGLDYTPPLENRVRLNAYLSCNIKQRRLLFLRCQVMLMLIRLIIMLEVSKPQQGLELVPVGFKNSRNVSYQLCLVI